MERQKTSCHGNKWRMNASGSTSVVTVVSEGYSLFSALCVLWACSLVVALALGALRHKNTAVEKDATHFYAELAQENERILQTLRVPNVTTLAGEKNDAD